MWLGSFGFNRARAGRRPVRLDSFGRALGVFGFIRVSRVHSGAPCVSSGSLGFVGIFRALPVGWLVH